VSGTRSERRSADLQASQAVFCFRGGGKVFASSCIWLCADWEGRARAGRDGGVGDESVQPKRKQATGAVGVEAVGQHRSAGQTHRQKTRAAEGDSPGQTSQE
jgi:hypothetical protein